MTLLQIFIGVSGLVFCGVFTLLVALIAASYVQLQRGRSNALLLLFFWIYYTSLYVLLLGSVSLLNPYIFIVVSFVVGVALVRYFSERISLMLADYKNYFGQVVHAILSKKWCYAFLGVVIFLLTIRTVLLTLYWPPYIYDVINYHLPKVADWIQYQKIFMLETAVSRAFWPANFELFQTWFLLFLHHDVIVEFAGVPFYILATISVFVICRSLYIGRRLSLFTALLYATTPSVVFFSICGKNDISVAAIYLFILAILLDFRKYGQFLKSRLVVIFMALNLAIGTKPIIVFILPGLLLIGLWSLMWHGRDKSWRNEGSEVSGPFLTLSVCSGFILGGYWYIRNIIVYGNPFYPAGFSFLGKLLYKGDGFPQQGAFQWSSLVENFLNLATTRIYDGALLQPDLPNIAGWGWFSFSIGLPCLLVGFFVIKEYRCIVIGFVISLLSLFGWVTPDPWNMRFTLWFPALFAVGFVLILRFFSEYIFRVVMVFFGVICLGLNLVATMNYGETPLPVWKYMACFPVLERSSAMLTTRYYEKLRRVLSKNEPIAYYGNGNMRIYSLYDSDLSHKVYYIDMSKIKMAEVNQTMQDFGVRVLFLEAEPNFIAAFDADLIKNKFIKLEANNIYERQ